MENKPLTKQQLIFCLIILIITVTAFGMAVCLYNINGMLGIFTLPVMLGVKEISKQLIYPNIKPKQ
jgi:hypothetical protein